ncbi:MAG: metal-dependent hydrolase [Cyanobacteria bacterium RM1_2_2]|nr:metal-dependent hydrolase [Cyanobacteria bacterium RM1_2_2]
MPSPIGHTIAGFCGFLLAPKGLIAKSQFNNTLLASIVLANLPDIDILPGLVLGNPAIFHRQGTHSITASILVGIFVSMLGRWNRASVKFIQLGVWATALYFSHIFLDLLVTDPSPPRGVQLLWPFSNAYFISPITIFNGFNYFDPEIGMLRSVLRLNNLMTALREIVLLMPIYGCIHYLLYLSTNEKVVKVMKRRR